LNDFHGLVAVVTGGSSGIGAAAARLLAARGAAVAVLDLQPPPDPTPRGSDGAGTFETCDVRDDASVQDAVNRVVEKLGGVDVVVANAGIGAQGSVEQTGDAEWLRVLDVNVLGTARVVRAALPYLRASGAPSVVVTTSVAAWAGLPRRAAYSASKGALLALTLAMAADHVGEGIRVNAVAPGTADTPWVGRLLDAAADPAAERAALEARQPMGRLVTPDEVAHAIAYLASPLSASTTGTVLAVDGGMYGLRPPR
jgi:NAD(P)-dependent dehydrogenase (short-subunit alcohol dehydrogenase family)